MTHGELVNWALTIHGSLLVAAWAAYGKYGDRTELISKSLQGVDETLRRIGLAMAEELGNALGPVFENAPIVSAGEGGKDIYKERQANPVGSELFREAIRDFITSEAEALSDYRTLLLARARWQLWARLLSWSNLLLIIWQVFVVGLLALGDKLLALHISDALIRWSSVPSSVGVVIGLACLTYTLRQHDVITRLRTEYDAP